MSEDDDDGIDGIDTESDSQPEPESPAARRKRLAEVASAKRTPEQSRKALRFKVRWFYDLQRMRIQVAGRISPKAPGAEIQLHEVDLAILERRASVLRREEREALRDVEAHLQTMPAWTQLLSDRKRFRGLGPTMAAVILAEIDIYRAATPSQIWSFAGLAPVQFHACGRCGAEVDPIEDSSGHYEHPENDCEHSGMVVYDENVVLRGRAARPIAGVKLGYNKWLRTRLVGVLGSCLLKSGSPYRSYYDNYKQRKVSAGWGRSDAHRHRASIRYMVKMLLADIWRDWRTLEGLPVRPLYQEQYLGHIHGAG